MRPAQEGTRPINYTMQCSQPVFVDPQLGPSLRNDLILPGRRILPDPRAISDVRRSCAASVACSRLHLSSTPIHRLCRLFPSFGGARILYVAKQVCPVPPSTCTPLPLGLMHIVPTALFRREKKKREREANRHDRFSSPCYGVYLDGARKAMLSAQPDSSCDKPHRLKSILHACPCVIHWPAHPGFSAHELGSPHSRAPDTVVLVYRSRVPVHLNPPVGPLFARQCDGHCP
ncbi:hypothetical protein LY76DRAFT_229724 [Colletotrichum caudatum]|nr:hypothetical protein LY76DRAFT_229724 [Colletotrichum caudatum]